MSDLLAVLDARDLAADGVIVGEWARCYGIDPRDVYRITLHFDGCLFARVHEWDADEHGRRYCPRQHAHLIDASDGDCEIARREPYDVTIIARGPQGIGDRVRAIDRVQDNWVPALFPVVAVVRAQLKQTRAAYDRRHRARARRNR
ncbi:hypothetical protein ACU635_50815 [[Actinomadura] parvosata]|uniref:hypothetical protein n=1 Tax=[Actinomadura] parvosata TaxID=1955412 RepID=UPI00406BEE5C